jgi:hypothetical protein
LSILFEFTFVEHFHELERCAERFIWNKKKNGPAMKRDAARQQLRPFLPPTVVAVVVVALLRARKKSDR